MPMDGTQIVTAFMGAVPATIAACAALVAARRTGHRGEIHKDVKRIDARLKKHERDHQLHPKLREGTSHA